MRCQLTLACGAPPDKSGADMLPFDQTCCPLTASACVCIRDVRVPPREAAFLSAWPVASKMVLSYVCCSAGKASLVALWLSLA